MKLLLVEELAGEAGQIDVRDLQRAVEILRKSVQLRGPMAEHPKRFKVRALGALAQSAHAIIEARLTRLQADLDERIASLEGELGPRIPR